MTIYFSKTTLGFYDSGIHGDAMPTDAVEITDVSYALLIEDQSAGQVIQAAADGTPEAVVPVPTAAQAQAALVALAQTALSKSDITVVRCISAQPPVTVPAELTAYRASLRAIVKGTDTTSTSLPTQPAEPEGI